METYFKKFVDSSSDEDEKLSEDSGDIIRDKPSQKVFDRDESESCVIFTSSEDDILVTEVTPPTS